MSQRKFFVSIFILYILVVQFAAARLHRDEEDDKTDSDDEYRLLKRFFFHHETTPSPYRSPSVLDNLVHPSSIGKTSSWPQKTTYSPSYPSSGACAPNPCEHGGICTSKGQLTYECRCVGPWRGIYCGIADACYRSPCQNGGTCLNVHDDYWCKCTSDYYGANCQSKFYSSTQSENHCRPYVCNTGRCVSLKTTYYCQCPDDRYGEHCEKRFSKRNMSSDQSYQNLLQQIKRGMHKKSTKDSDERTYYDAENGI